MNLNIFKLTVDKSITLDMMYPLKRNSRPKGNIMSVFKSKVYSSSLIDIAVDAFGFNDAHDAIVEDKPWGNMLTVKRGQNAGVYDIHSFNGETVFIAA